MSIATKNINAEKIQGNLSINSITANTITATTISGGTLYGDGSNLTGLSTGLNVGTSQLTSGTDTRVLFQSGTTLQQDSNFSYNTTQKRLILQANGTTVTNIPLQILNSAGSANLVEIAGNNTFTFLSTPGKAVLSNVSNGGPLLTFGRDYTNQEVVRISGNDYPSISLTKLNTTSSISIGTVANGISMNYNAATGDDSFQIQNSFHNVFQVIGNPNSASASFRLGSISSNANFFNLYGPNGGGTGINATQLFNVNTNGNVGIGMVTTGARLDVRAQGALSTNIAFRVRNSADTADLFKIRGNASTIFGGTGADYLSIIGGSNWGTDCYFDFSGGNYIRFLGQSGDISIFTNSSLRSRGTYIGGATQLVYFDNGGNIRIGQGHSNVNQPDVNATRTIQQMTGVAPTTSVADGFQQYSADITAGNAAPHFRTENGVIIKLYQQPSVTTSQGIADVLTNLGFISSGSTIDSIDQLQVVLNSQVYS